MKKWLLLIAIDCVIVAIFLSWLVFIRIPENERKREITFRQANLRSVLSIVLHGNAFIKDGVFRDPSQYGEALMETNQLWPEPLFGPEETQDLVWIVPIPWPDRRIPDDITQEELAQIPLLHERVDLNPDGTSVAFWDGSVRLLTNEEFEAIIDVEQSVCLACEFGTNNWLKKRGP
jgi:hypothetical protein